MFCVLISWIINRLQIVFMLYLVENKLEHAMNVATFRIDQSNLDASELHFDFFAIGRFTIWSLSLLN